MRVRNQVTAETKIGQLFVRSGILQPAERMGIIRSWSREGNQLARDWNRQ